MKKSITLFAMLFITIALNAQTKPTDTDGDGYKNISTLDHLQWLSEHSDSWRLKYELDNDINAGDTRNWNNGAGWKPIGNRETPFTGKFDGHNFEIDSLYINSINQKNVGFFGWVQSYHINSTPYQSYDTAEIKNLGITHYLFKDSSRSSLSKAGGLIGCNDKGYISNCYSTGNASNNGMVGGLIGYNTGSIDNCYSSSRSSGRSLGGLVARNEGNITNCYSTGNSATEILAVASGGFVGLNEGNITNSYSTGNSAAFQWSGGFVGLNEGNITNSYSTGNSGVANTSSNSGASGGFIGSNEGNINNCYSIGGVTSNSPETIEVGGFIGTNKNYMCIVSNCFWNSQTSGQNISAGGTPKTTAEMKTKSTYTDAGWNFIFIWDITNSYPFININMAYRPIDTDNNGSLNIKTLSDLRWISESGYDLNKNIELDNDINAGVTKKWNNGEGWIPIGKLKNTPFEGSFFGNGYVIDSLYINRPNQNYIGFLGYIKGTNIYDLGIINCDITGKSLVGGLAGYYEGTYTSCIFNSYSTGNIYGHSDSIGGLIGRAERLHIYNSYSRCNLSGNSYVGGFIGFFNGYLINCYSTGHINGRSDAIGGFIGQCPVSSYCFSCFWDVQSSGQSNSAAGTGLTTSEIKTRSTFVNAQWNCCTLWDVDNDYPVHNRDVNKPIDTDGDGYINLSSLCHLRWVSENNSSWAWDFELDNDIDASNTSWWNNKKGFNPIGNELTKFTGKFEGHKHKIDSLYIKTVGYIGLFGYITASEIHNLGIENSSVSSIRKDGSGPAGIIVGYMSEQSVINNCSSSGVVIGYLQVGGLVGFQNNSTINNSTSSGTVHGKQAGGLVGYNYLSTINNSYSSGINAGSSKVGGLVGYNHLSTINNSYATGSARGSNFREDDVVGVGGLVGYNHLSIINNSYATGNVRTPYNNDITGKGTGGLVGYNDSSKVYNSYATGSVTANEIAGGLIGVLTSNSIVSNSYSMGSVYVTNSYAGGLVGVGGHSIIINSFSRGHVEAENYKTGGIIGSAYYMQISNSYATGKIISARFDAGGICGKTVNRKVENSFFDMETSGIKHYRGGGTPKTTAEMKTKSTFTDSGWDFNEIWNIDPTINNGYPFLTSVPVSILENKTEETNNLLVYPNPISQGNTLNITFEHKIANYTIAIYNMEGLLVAKNNQFDSMQINENFPIGSYFIVILDKGEIIASEKFIVK